MQESVEKINIGDLKVVAKKQGYRHSIDPFLLCYFAGIKTDEVVADLGCATGIIPLCLSKMARPKKIIGFEIQSHLAALAKKNILLNELESLIEIREFDVRQLASSGHFRESQCNVVLTNPPYYKKGTGRYPKDNERAMCRHALAGEIDDFLKAASYLLFRGGRFCVSFLAERTDELFTVMRENKLFPKRLRHVKSFCDSEPHIILLESLYNVEGEMVIDDPLIIYEDRGHYSHEVLSIFV